MTVTYSLEVANSKFCGFAKLLIRWKGSIYQILWKEFLIFCICYIFLSLLYRFSLKGQAKVDFEKFVIFVDNLTDLIPLSFVLGFYVSLVIGRWWAQYEAIPWPDRLCLMIGSYVHGADERSRMIRRTLARYLVIMQALTFQAVSTSVKKRFPTTHHLVAAGIMTPEEQTVYDKVCFGYGKWWLPAQWFSSLLMRAKKEGRIKDSILLDGLFRELLAYRGACGSMLNYDWISVPLVYTQVVTLGTYLYAVALIIGRQYLDPKKCYPKHQVDLYVPFITIIQFFFYVGWLKVAEQIVNPYGEDADDFELNWCLDRAVHVTYLLVDQLQTKHPKVKKDYFWDDLEPRLPQTKHSAKSTENPQIGSAFNLEVEEAKYLPLDTFLEQDADENIYTSFSIRKRGESMFRSSVIMRAFGSKFGQSFRNASVRKEDVVNSSARSRFYGSHSLAVGDDKSTPTTPAMSRKSSYKTSTNITSPPHSRNSSISFQPNSVNLRRLKSLDAQDLEKTLQPNVLQDSAAFGTPLPPNTTLPHHLEIILSGTEERCDSEVENVGQQRLDIVMPSIPEEPSRISSAYDPEEPSNVCDDIETDADDQPTPGVHSELDDLVKEANTVLKELNKTISSQGHQHDCALKGYESCCSLSSDSSSEDEGDDLDQAETNEPERCDTTIVVEDVTAIVEN